MQIDRSKTYELHRPKAMADADTENRVRAMLSPAQFDSWKKSRDWAGTAGPIMIGPKGAMRPSLFSGEKIYELFLKALTGGANPCYEDEETGQVHMGEFVFVPLKEND